MSIYHFLSPYLRPHLRSFIGALLLKTAELGLASLPYLLFFASLTYLVEGQFRYFGLESLSQTEIIILLSLAILISLAGQAILNYLANRLFHKIAYRLSARIREDFFVKLRHSALKTLYKYEAGDLTHRLSKDMGLIELYPTMIFPRLWAAFVFPLIWAALFCLIDPLISLSFLISLGCFLVIGKLSQSYLLTYSRHFQQAQIALHKQIGHLVQMIPLYKSYPNHAKMNDLIDHFQDKSHQMTSAYIAPNLGLGLAIMVSCSLFFYLGLQTYQENILALPEAVFLILISFRLSFPLLEWLDFNVLGQQMSFAAERLQEVLNLPEENHHLSKTESAAQPFQLCHYPIHIQNLSFAYPPRRTETPQEIFDQINLICPSGQITALAGPSGCGKTTLAHLIMQHYQPKTGQICFGDRPISEIAREDFYQLIHYMPQQPFFFSETISNNLCLGADIDLTEIEAACRLAQCHDVIMALPQQYQTILVNNGGFLSGGEKQRLALARAILQKTPILLLDEVTAGLDIENEAKLLATLKKLKTDKTILMMTHRLPSLILADQVLFWGKDQKIVAGTHTHLLNEHSDYKDYWASQYPD